MYIKNIEEQKKIFKRYTNNYIRQSNVDKVEGYKYKQEHSITVLDEALLIDQIFTKYNDSFKRLLALESLFHDVGRFEQLRITGTFSDSEIKNFYSSNITDHGDLGAIMMESDNLLAKLIPESDIYDEEIKKVIRAHSKVNIDLVNGIDIKTIEKFRNYDLIEIFKSKNSEKYKNILYSTNTAIVQDVDRLDIIRKISNGKLKQGVSLEKIDKEIYELYKQGKLPPLKEIKEQGKWSPNIKHLVRLDFINQTNLIPVLLKIKEENLIDKLYKESGNEVVREAYEFAKENLEKLIQSTDDGILVKKKILK